MQQLFAIGDKVQMPAFINCFGERISQTGVLTVTEVRLFKSESTSIYPITPYFRLVATTNDGFGFYEGPERFFDEVR